ncbi:Flagellar hook-associated protein 2 [Anatilimnocola aggregata]|uniref:Filament cap protein n=1 Tax=Anatilimnocola aggregata TaxID=2528021 RepID=A0A517YL79_9BACT|nr:flagellar filament capping protein FliD [Anatilimnocola aggregata]QDU30987.1 Flagellar hook-associated protein 2 [Anatilimnocola aggregata]
MGRITSSVGLATGINIEDTVNKLIELSAKPRELASARKVAIGTQQAAITDLTAVTLGVQLAVRRLKNASIFTKSTITSSSTALTAVTTGAVAAGNYQFTAVRKAQNAQLLSAGVVAKDQPLGAGSFTFRFGGAITEPVSLDALNGGQGVTRGKIRITDRNGDSSVIDLRFAQTIDDVLTAINSADGIEVNASVSGDRLILTDQSGGTSNLRVQEVSGGSTAADLGLANINVAANSATGNDVLRLSNSTALAQLNDGTGLSTRTGVSDLNVTLRDGTSLEIDFNLVGKAATASSATTSAANGVNAQLKLTAKTVGGDYDGVQIQFVDSGNVTAGNEVASYDAQSKILTVDIAAGSTTADNVISAINSTTATSTLFTATTGTGGNGDDLVSLADTATTTGGAAVAARSEKTLGELIATINGVNPAKLKAEISPDGDRIVLTDLSTDTGGTFAVSNTAGGTLAEDLGLTGTASGATLTSDRLQGGLNSPLLRSLNGGRGFGALGEIDLTDRSGATATISLSGAETLDDVIAAIAGSGLGLKAEINAAKNGLQIVDTTGGTASNLIVADGDGTNSATKLGIVGNVADSSVRGTSLNRQTVSEHTLLSDFNAGKGVAKGSFLITDSAGAVGAVNLTQLNATTLGDVIDAINAQSIGVEARINDTGDGIALIDTAGGSSRLKVETVNNSKVVADLHLGTEAVDTTEDGNPAQVISGTTAFTVTLDADDTLTDLVTKINALGANVTASVISDSAGTLRHHLSLVSGISGKAGDLNVDGSSLGLKFQSLSTAQDALLLVGSDASSGRLITSTSNTFENVVDGLNITVSATSTESISVGVTPTSSDIEGAIQTFVDQYNKLRDKIAAYTFYNQDDDTKGTLFGSSDVLRLDSDLSRALTSRFFGSTVRSFNELGISADEEGKLTFDKTRLQARYASDPQGLEKFFSDEEQGFATKVDAVLEKLVGRTNSTFVNRAATLQRQLEDTTKRIDSLTLSLNKERERLTLQFYNMELAISKIKNSLTAIESIKYINPDGTTS